MKVRFKKIIVSLAVVASFIAYAFSERFGLGKTEQKSETNPDTQNTASNASSSNSVAKKPESPVVTPTSTPTVVPVVPAAPTVPPKKPVISKAPATSVMKDGVYTGASADAYYGNVQVRAVIQGGRLADVQLADYPKENQTSVLINDQALQILKSEALRAQSGNIDAVSGATYTSYAYITSLSSALTKARGNAPAPSAIIKKPPLPKPPAPAPAPLPVPPPAVPTTTPPQNNPNAMFVDGQYTGAAVDANYGTVQVKAIIQNGKIADVQFLNYPQDRQTSVLINNQATPILRSEAIQAQSAQVSAVSGATYTSYAFMQSLTSALNQALAKPQSPTQPAPTLPPAPQMPPPNNNEYEDD